MTDKIQGSNADHGSVSVGHNDGLITIKNKTLIQQGLTDEARQEQETQYLRRVVADCGGLEWLALMNLEEGDSSMGLDAVYTALLTESRLEQELTEGGKTRPEILKFWGHITYFH